MPTREQQNGYKRAYRERNRDRINARRCDTERAWYKRNRKRQTAYKRAMRAKARDKGRCGICITKHCEPGYKTCPSCLSNISNRRQVRREAARWEMPL